MKNLVFALLGVFLAGSVMAQSEPVKWNFTSKKISDKVYEIHLTATLDKGWHIYSQTQPKDAISQPTKIAFITNPLLNLDGKVKEVGKMEKFHDAALGASANQYSKTVNFVQKVTLKAAAKTSVAGTVEYQLCDDSKCLPPKKMPFKVNVG
ncbi:MAG: hypothetical protein IPH58_12905 [Sphingobacteriales bacterium]|jgi:DsbC/DsbD-like thiol-disulfide interchange protein|nr:hypothetical protein [Sphingobacteriales bacterium]